MADTELNPRLPDPNKSHPAGQTPVLPPISSGDATTPPDEETVVGPLSADRPRETLDFAACNDSAAATENVPRLDYLWTMATNVGASPLEERTEIMPGLDPSAVDEPTRVQQIRIEHSRPVPEHQRPSDQQRYTMGADVARGGLGKIRSAVDKRIQREVAFKELLPKALSNGAFIERFLEEAQITGQLEHPGIVPVYDLGWQDNGTPYYAMKLVRGDTFKKAIEELHKLPPESAERRLTFTRYLRCFVSICNAIAFAHHRGVLHRDLKPQNVMLGQFGETLVLDWGLAKIIGAPESRLPSSSVQVDVSDASSESAADEATIISGAPELEPTVHTSRAASQSVEQFHSGGPQASQGTFGQSRQTVSTNVRTDASKTQMGSILGTPSYMPPEQSRGLVHELDERADIYSLGAILYELLTDKPPVARGKDLFLRVQRGEIPAPRSILKTVPAPLEAIALHALALKKEDRYPTAIALAEDVERYLADEPVSVYRDPWQVRLRRWIGRHRSLVTSSAVALLLLIVGVSGARWFETQRVARLQARTRLELDAAQGALAQGRLGDAGAALERANGLLAGEPALQAFAGEVHLAELSVAQRAADQEEARLSALRQQAEQKVQSARTATDVQHNFPVAVALLTEVTTLLQDEPRLKPLFNDARNLRQTVEQQLARQRQETQETQQFEKFESDVERARFFSTNLVGDTAQGSAELAQSAADRALALYGLDQPGPFVVPKTFTPARAALVQEHLHELLVLSAIARRAQSHTLAAAQRQPLLNAALAQLERSSALRKDLKLPESQTALLLHAVLLEELDKKSAAAKLRRQAATLTPQTAADFFLLAQHEQNVNRRYAEASQLYQQVLSKEPNHFLAMYSLGICNLQRLAEMGQSSDTPDAEVSGYLSAAVTAFTGCLALRPDFPWPYVMRGVANHSLGRFDEADADFATAEKLRNAPGAYDSATFQFVIHMNRGTVYFKQDRLDEAEREFVAAGKLRADSPDQPINLARIAARREQFDEALKHLQAAARRDPQNPVPYRLQGDVYTSLHARDPKTYPDQKALNALDSALTRETSTGQQGADHYDIGRIHFRAQRWPLALAAFDQSVALSPRMADAHRLRGETLLNLKREADAVAALSQYLKLAPKPHVDAYRARGLAYATLGQYREATNDYTRALELDPKSANMHTRLGWAYLLKNYQLAEQDFDAAVKENPENGDSYNGRGYARVKQGRHAAAVADAESAVKATPDVWPIWFNAATIYAQALPALDRDSKLAPSERKTLREKYLDRAIELLHKTATLSDPAEFKANLQQDDALDPLRDTAEFKALVP